jgi:glycosyltransferase involved in cell wall biosynthesis
MNSPDLKSLDRAAEGRRAAASVTADSRPLVSIVMPAFNEAAIIEQNLGRVCDYMRTIENSYRWELVIVNDGSEDATGTLAEGFAHDRDNVHVYHHHTNFGLGQAFRFAFAHCSGDYVVTLDTDLSYSPPHIGELLARISETRAKIVLTSPYMKGGRVSNVPWLRRKLSTWANRFLSVSANGRMATLTSMVRAYDGRFLRSLNLRAMGMDVMPEIIYKASMLRARIEEIPAHLDWGPLKAKKAPRRSSMRILRHTAATIVTGFLFRPVAFFILPGLLTFLFSVYVNGWTLAHFFEQYRNLAQYPQMAERASAAVSAAYAHSPHTFIIGLLSLMLSIQLISLGILALQSKSYFEELFHLASGIYRVQQDESYSGGPPSSRT